MGTTLGAAAAARQGGGCVLQASQSFFHALFALCTRERRSRSLRQPAGAIEWRQPWALSPGAVGRRAGVVLGAVAPGGSSS
jgi:hypothetical protein